LDSNGSNSDFVLNVSGICISWLFGVSFIYILWSVAPFRPLPPRRSPVSKAVSLIYSNCLDAA